MKKTNIFIKIRAIFALIVVVAFFAGCSNTFESTDSSAKKKGRILFFPTSFRSAYTVYPTGFDFEKDSGLTFTLTGALNNGANQTLGTWNDTENKKSYAVMNGDNSILVDLGNWNFRLSVTKNGSEVLYGTLEKEIVLGENILDFGTLSGSESGTVNFTLLFPKDTAKIAEVVMFGINSEKLDDSEDMEITAAKNDDTKDSITYKKDVKAGTYILQAKLYSSSDKENAVFTTYATVVMVAGGAESRSTQYVDEMNRFVVVTKDSAVYVRGNIDGNDLKSIASTLKNGTDQITLDLSGTNILGIDESLFAGNKRLVGIVLPDSLHSIYKSAFENCTNLESITIPNVTNIGERAFSGCTNLKSVTIPNGVTRINASTFNRCINLTSVTIPDSVIDIEEYAFWSCLSLESIVIPNKVSRIKKYTFFDCSKLSSVIFPETVSTIEESAFSGCTSLASITIPYIAGNIEKNAFKKCSGLTDVTILKGVITTIGEYAFDACSSLKSITMPSSRVSIGEYAFNGCKCLESISNVWNVGDSAFSDCGNLKSIKIEGESIGNSAFKNCLSLESVSITAMVRSIGNYAFAYCKTLKELTIPNSVSKIGMYAFGDCENLTRVTFLYPNYFTLYYTDNSDYTGGTSVSTSTLESAPGSVAIYLNQTYKYCYWYKVYKN